MFTGANGAITSFPNTGEKCCVSCEFWCGRRSITHNGAAATSINGSSYPCEIIKKLTRPNQPCVCNSYDVWMNMK